MVSAGNLQWKHSHNPDPSGSPGVSHAGYADLAVIALDDTGEIHDCSRACEEVFGYRSEELAGRHVSTLLPQLADGELIVDDRVHPRLAFLSRVAMPFEARHRDGTRFNSELFINLLDRDKLVVLVRSLKKTLASR